MPDELEKREKNIYVDSKVDTIENQVEKSMDLRKNKMLIEFSNCEGALVKLIAVKRPESVKTTTRFLAGKMLMFAKLSWKSFIYQVSELLTFPNDVVQEIYAKYGIEKIYLYHILTDTVSTSLQIVAISATNSQFADPEFRNILFEVFSSTDICQRFDKSDKFWKQFGVHDQANRKVLGLYEVESINDPCLVTLAVNPKEYLEYFESTRVNKKQKGLKK